MTGILAVLAALALAGLDYFLIAVCCRPNSAAGSGIGVTLKRRLICHATTSAQTEKPE